VRGSLQLGAEYEREGEIMAQNIFKKCPTCGRLIAGDYCSHPTQERGQEMSACNWCGDVMKEGAYEVHKCIEESEV
jgi:hypothetical protein